MHEVSVFIKDLTMNDLIIANKHIRKGKTENSPIKTLDIEDLKQCHIICFSDASYVNVSPLLKEDLLCLCIEMRNCFP